MKPIHAAFLAALIILPSCGSSSSGPAGQAVQLALSPEHASGSSAHPLTFHAVVGNAGLRPVWHYEGCSAGSGIRIDYYDSQGNPVWTKDPYGPKPACGDQLMTLAVGGRIESASSFDGTLYNWEPDPAHRRYPAPSGRYRAVATFTYYEDAAGRLPEHVMVHSVEFDWDGPESTEVALSGDARESCLLTHHFILSGRVLNTGAYPVRDPSGCSPFRVRLFDPDGHEVVFEDPAQASPCSDPLMTLYPGDDVQGEFEFGGDAYVPVAGGYERSPAPEGLYTVRLEFRYLDINSVERIETQTATFTWSNAVTCGT